MSTTQLYTQLKLYNILLHLHNILFEDLKVLKRTEFRSSVFTLA